MQCHEDSIMADLSDKQNTEYSTNQNEILVKK